MFLRLPRERKKRIGRPSRKRIAGRRENGSAESRRDRTSLGVGTRHVIVRGAGVGIGVRRRSYSSCMWVAAGVSDLGLRRRSCFCPSLYIGAFARESEPLARKIFARGVLRRLAKHPLAAAWLASKTRLRRRRFLDSRMDPGGFSRKLASFPMVWRGMRQDPCERC